MTAFTDAEFAAAYLTYPTAKRTAWLNDMCTSAHTLACLMTVAKRMAGAWVAGREIEAIAGNWLIEALKARGHLSE